jgi:phospholipase/carboxylesterase
MELLPSVDVSTGTNPKHAIVWLHGLGADGFDFEPVVKELNLPSELPVRFILPHAPMIPVTVNGGYMMPGWYDILSQEIERECDQEGVRRSADEIWNIVDALIESGYAPENIALAGFSQGGAVVHRCAMDGRPLAGVISLSSYIANEEDPVVMPNFPIFLGHGIDDPIVPMELGERALMRYNDWESDVDFKEYPMEHSIHPQEVVDVRNFIVKIFS